MSKKKNKNNQVILEKEENLKDCANNDSSKKQDQIEQEELEMSTNAVDVKENEQAFIKKENVEQEEKEDLVSSVENEVEETQTNTTNQEEKITTCSKKKSHKTVIALSLACVILLLLFCLFSTVFAFVTSHSSTIINGVSINNINVSGLTKEEALQKVSTALNEKLSQPITLKHNEYEVTVFPEQFDVSFSLEECIDMAYQIGRSRKSFSK